MFKKLIGITGGLVLTAFIGYCIYFDKKRRSPEYRKKQRLLKERQKQMKAYTRKKPQVAKDKTPGIVSLELENTFMQCIHLGEMAITAGDFQRGVHYLSNAMTICKQPLELLEMVQERLPSEFYDMFVQHLEACGSLPAEMMLTNDV